MVEFLRSTPCWTNLPKSILNRIYYGIEKKKLIKGQNVITEGDAVNYIYFIKDGNFEMTKRLVINDKVKNQKVEEDTVIRTLICNNSKSDLKSHHINLSDLSNKSNGNIHIRRALGKSFVLL